MTPSLRELRALADEIVPPPYRTRRQNDRYERILTIAEVMMARYGIHGVTFRAMAVALRMATFTLRLHFVDIDALCGEILRRHLRKIADAIGTIPHDAENRRQRQREAYVQATRHPWGGLTNAHLILTRDRQFLPEDERDQIERLRTGLAELLAGPGNPDILHILDTPWIAPDQMEQAITLLSPAAPQSLPVAAEASTAQPQTTPPQKAEISPPPPPAATSEPTPRQPEPAQATAPAEEDPWGDGCPTFGNTPPEWNIKRRPPHIWPEVDPGPLARLTDDELEAEHRRHQPNHRKTRRAA
jgi:AcrR family transcriptional regulator